MTGADDLRLGHLDEGSMNTIVRAPFHSRFGRQVCQPFEGFEKRRPAIGIAGEIDSVDPDENILRPEDLAPAQGKTEKDGVPRGNVCCGNLRSHLLDRSPLGDVDVRRQR